MSQRNGSQELQVSFHKNQQPLLALALFFLPLARSRLPLHGSCGLASLSTFPTEFAAHRCAERKFRVGAKTARLTHTSVTKDGDTMRFDCCWLMLRLASIFR